MSTQNDAAEQWQFAAGRHHTQTSHDPECSMWHYESDDYDPNCRACRLLAVNGVTVQRAARDRDQGGPS